MKIQEIRARQALNECKRYDTIKVIHAENPKTIIGKKEYSLVFPHFISNMFVYCKDIDISFEGLVTAKRQVFLYKIYETYENEHHNIKIISSKRGRQDKVKEIDHKYFETLHRSKFIACPNGDFVWSYRFFEAIICKAIPIIENESPLYDGYKFYRLGDKLEYRQDWVGHNLLKIKKEMML